jgi:hypothetical protein
MSLESTKKTEDVVFHCPVCFGNTFSSKSVMNARGEFDIVLYMCSNTTPRGRSCDFAWKPEESWKYYELVIKTVIVRRFASSEEFDLLA